MPGASTNCENYEPDTLQSQPKSFCYCKDCVVGGIERFGREWCHCPGCENCDKYPLSLPCDVKCDPEDPSLTVETWLDCFCTLDTTSDGFKNFCCDDSIPLARRTPEPICVPICEKFPLTPGCEDNKNFDCSADRFPWAN